MMAKRRRTDPKKEKAFNESLEEEDLGCTKIGWERSIKIDSLKPRMETETPTPQVLTSIGRGRTMAEISYHIHPHEDLCVASAPPTIDASPTMVG